MTESACCHPHGSEKSRRDILFWLCSALIAAALVAHFIMPDLPYVGVFNAAVVEFLSVMWWGIILGIVFVGAMGQIPRAYFQAVLGRGDTPAGVMRAMIAGLFMDLCSHGILMIGAKMYERGASLGQVMAFLIASPWNSLSLTVILIALVGLPWTLTFVIGSAAIAFISGLIFNILVQRGVLPENPAAPDIHEPPLPLRSVFNDLLGFRPTRAFVKTTVIKGIMESRAVIRWLLLGILIAAALRAFISPHSFAVIFGPTVLGLLTTLVATTVIEVCSEGSAPIAADIMSRAAAPGNAFAFLMAGVSTDYTEIMVLREATKSLKIALFLPLVTVPQVLLLGWIMNVVG